MRRATPAASPAKPIPAGLVDAGSARVGVVVAAAGWASRSAVPSGPAVGRARGRRPRRSAMPTTCVAKGTAWSWVPFAVGIPLLPVFAWLGAAGWRCRAFVRRPAAGRPSSPGPGWRSPMPARTSSGMRRPASSRSRPRWVATGRGGSTPASRGVVRPRRVRLARRGGGDARARDQPPSTIWPAVIAACVADSGRWRGLPGGARVDASGRGSSRPSGRGRWPSAWLAGMVSPPPALTRSGRPAVVAPDEGDRVLELSFAIVRYFARFARSTRPMAGGRPGRGARRPAPRPRRPAAAWR